MSEMVERVARAIWEIGASDDISECDAAMYASAAIEAMREPTQEMVDAAIANADGVILPWDAMIDAALEQSA